MIFFLTKKSTIDFWQVLFTPLDLQENAWHEKKTEINITEPKWHVFKLFFILILVYYWRKQNQQHYKPKFVHKNSSWFSLFWFRTKVKRDFLFWMMISLFLNLALKINHSKIFGKKMYLLLRGIISPGPAKR